MTWNDMETLTRVRQRPGGRNPNFEFSNGHDGIASLQSPHTSSRLRRRLSHQLRPAEISNVASRANIQSWLLREAANP